MMAWFIINNGDQMNVTGPTMFKYLQWCVGYRKIYNASHFIHMDISYIIVSYSKSIYVHGQQFLVF